MGWSISTITAATAPTLLAYNPPPSPTLLNQLLAVMLWGAFVALHRPAHRGLAAASMGGTGTAAALAALALLAAATAASWAWRGLPASHALSALGLLACAGAVAAAAAATPEADARAAFTAFCVGWAAAAAAGAAVGAVQVFAPAWADGTWIAATTIEGRAVGNLRQPNHLSSVLLWGCVAVAALHALRRLPAVVAAAALVVLVGAVVLTASRTGLLSVGLLALWGLADARLPRPVRAALLATPLVYGAWWAAMAEWASLSGHAFGGAQRLAETDISGSRFGIWRDTLTLIAQQPWGGVGVGNFNLAWTLTPLPQRPTAFFDHAHNLPLQLLVELGLPLGFTVLALLVLPLAAAAWGAFAWGWRRGGRAADAAATAQADASLPQRAALVMVAMIGLHSLLEYPLWYAHFLLPAAWALGMALRRPCPTAGERDDAAAAAMPAAPVMAATGVPAAPRAARAGWASVAGGTMLLAAPLAVLDYTAVVDIYTVRDGAAPLAQRIARGQRSVLFAHHADYAAVTTPLLASAAAAPPPAAAFERTVHHLLDTRLMIAWAEALQRDGLGDHARHLAARLREFRKADAEAFFAPCAPAAGDAGAAVVVGAGADVVPGATAAGAAQVRAAGDAVPAFPCSAPARALPWTAFLPPG